jgi:hypothetical protein
MHILSRLELSYVIGGISGRSQSPSTMPANKQVKNPLEAKADQGPPPLAQPLPQIALAQPPPQIGFQPVVGPQRLGGSMPTPEK